MKIPGKKGAQIDAAELVRLKQEQQQASQQAAQQASQNARGSGSDSVDIGLSRAIQNLISLEEIQEEREAKKARLKELVQSGKYSTDSEEVARKLGEEISYEIYANSDKGGE